MWAHQGNKSETIGVLKIKKNNTFQPLGTQYQPLKAYELK